MAVPATHINPAVFPEKLHPSSAATNPWLTGFPGDSAIGYPTRDPERSPPHSPGGIAVCADKPGSNHPPGTGNHDQNLLEYRY